MTFALIALAVVLTAATVWFLTRPLRGAPVGDGERSEEYHQLTHVRERLLAQLNELDVDAHDNAMDAGVQADERLRLEGELAQVLKRLEQLAAPDKPERGERAGRELWIASLVLAVAFPLVAVGLYGAKHHETLARLDDPQTTPESVPPMVREMVARLERRLQEQPNDAEGWARLGRAYEVLQRPDDAKQAYTRAHALAPNNADIIAAYAGMLVALDPKNPPAEAAALFRRLHQMDPHHPGALWVLGLTAYNENKFRQAIQYWEALLKELPPESEVAPEIRHALDAARNRMAQKK